MVDARLDLAVMTVLSAIRRDFDFSEADVARPHPKLEKRVRSARDFIVSMASLDGRWNV